jgi:exodeoxyribonuclease VII large subunit
MLDQNQNDKDIKFMVGSEPTFSVSEAVAVLNQTLESLYPTITIVGELANYKIAKNRWVYADIKDDIAKLRCFGTIYQLPGPLEDGMLVEIVAEPRLHPQFGFSLNMRSIRPIGEGSIKKAANLLQAKLEKEGLFAPERKRTIPYAPTKVGLIASEQSAAYADFMKILNARWSGVEIELFDATVQGESAPESLIAALQYFNQQSEPQDVLVMIRGGGSADDLSAFSVEQVTRAVAGSRIPTVVAVGHEVDVSLAELAADLRASTPSNAAELLFPDKNEIKKQLVLQQKNLRDSVFQFLENKSQTLQESKSNLQTYVESYLENKSQELKHAVSLLESVHPKATLKRGYALMQSQGKLITSIKQLKVGADIQLTVQDGSANAVVKEVQ